MRIVTGIETALARRRIDELLERYISWREECYAVQLAYRWFADSRLSERRLAYAGYLAALDREERAAHVYADHIERVRRVSA